MYLYKYVLLKYELLFKLKQTEYLLLPRKLVQLSCKHHGTINIFRSQYFEVRYISKNKYMYV